MPEQPDKLKAQAEEHERLANAAVDPEEKKRLRGLARAGAQYGSDRERSFLGAVAPGRYGVKVSGTIVTGTYFNPRAMLGEYRPAARPCREKARVAERLVLPANTLANSPAG